MEKVIKGDVNIGLGYVSVRNRIGHESYDDAWLEEHKLFTTHPMLSKIDDRRYSYFGSKAGPDSREHHLEMSA